MKLRFPFIIFVCGFLALVPGCSTPQPPNKAEDATYRKVADQEAQSLRPGEEPDEVLGEIQRRQKAESQVKVLRVRVAELEEENRELAEKLTNAVNLLGELKTLRDYVKLHELVAVQREEVTKRLNEAMQSQMEMIFSSLMGQGKLMEAEVDEVIVYNGLIHTGVTMFAMADNGTGELLTGRCELDPKVGEIKIAKTVLISRVPLTTTDVKKLVQMTQGTPAQEGVKPGIVQKAQGAWESFSPETRDRIINGTIAVGSALILKLFSGSESQ